MLTIYTVFHDISCVLLTLRGGRVADTPCSEVAGRVGVDTIPALVFWVILGRGGYQHAGQKGSVLGGVEGVYSYGEPQCS
jgi:hypothetical protein